MTQIGPAGNVLENDMFFMKIIAHFHQSISSYKEARKDY